MPLNINLQQIFLHLLNFVILFAGLYFLLYKPVLQFIQKREESYREMDDTARNNYAASEQLKETYEAKLSGAEAEIRQMKEQARNEMYAEKAARIKQAEREAGDIIEKAHADAMTEYYKIISDSQKEIESIVYRAAKRVMTKTASEGFDQFLSAVDAAEEEAADE